MEEDLRSLGAGLRDMAAGLVYMSLRYFEECGGAGHK